MRGDEARVVAAFVRWLETQGWTVQTEVGFVDIVARRGTSTLYGEAKGRTAAIGLDVDTLYGQLLRRMPVEPQPYMSFAVVVPEEAIVAADRVPRWVRDRLNITVYGVAADGAVTER